MFSSRLVHFLLVALGLVAAIQATYIVNPRSPLMGPDLQVRQDASTADPSGGGSAPSASQTGGGAASEPSPSASTPQADPSTTADAVTTTSQQQQPETTPSPSNTPAPSPSASEAQTTTQGQPQETTTTQGNNDQQTTTTEQQQQETTAEPSTLTSWVVLTSTAENGDIVSLTSAQTFTTTPTINAGSGNSGGGGMPTNTRNIVIGVVCGVGGAIVLGALGFVAWRVWGRKKRAEENDALMDYHTAGTSAFNSEPKPDASSSATGPNRSPFQTTLEDYHRPGQVNASSNF